MSTLSNRPNGIPFFAATGEPAGNIKPVRESLFRLKGYEKNSIIPSDEHNGKFQSYGFWFSYLDCGTLRLGDWLDTTEIRQLSPDSLAYAIGESVVAAPGASVATRTSVLFNGVRIETDNEFLQTLAGQSNFFADPLWVSTATVPGRVWVYIHDDGVNPPGVRVVSAGPVEVDTPGANEQALVGVDIDGTGLVTGHTAPTTQPLIHELPVVTPVAFDQVSMQDLSVVDTLGVGGLSTLDSLTVTGVTLLNGAVTLGDDAADVVLVPGTASFTELVTFSSGVQGPASGPVVLTEGATIAASKTVVGDATTSITTGDVTSLGTIEVTTGIQGAASTPVPLIEGAALASGTDVSGDGTTGVSVGTVTSSGVVEATLGFQAVGATAANLPQGATSPGTITAVEHRYSDTGTLPTVNGATRMRNGNLIMRREGQTLSVFIPTESFLASFTSTGNGYATAMQVTRALDADETAVVEVKCWAYRAGGSVATMDWRVRSSLIIANVFEDGVTLGNGANSKKVIHSRVPFIPSALEGGLSGMGTHVFDLQFDRNEALIQEITALEIWLTVRSGVQVL